jgi:hypothetical protein
LRRTFERARELFAFEFRQGIIEHIVADIRSTRGLYFVADGG